MDFSSGLQPVDGDLLDTLQIRICHSDLGASYFSIISGGAVLAAEGGQHSYRQVDTMLIFPSMHTENKHRCLFVQWRGVIYSFLMTMKDTILVLHSLHTSTQVQHHK